MRESEGRWHDREFAHFACFVLRGTACKFGHNMIVSLRVMPDHMLVGWFVLRGSAYEHTHV